MVVMAEQNHFYPIHLTRLTVYSMETKDMSGVFIQILIARTVTRTVATGPFHANTSGVSNSTNTSREKTGCPI